MSIFAAALVALQTPPASAPPPVVSVRGQDIYLDTERDIRVSYVEFSNGKVVFAARLPEKWTFSVDIDGNQDGVWGAGRGMPPNSVTASADRSFGQSQDHGVFCSQYIFTTFERDPAEIYAKSDCGDLPSNGMVTMSGFDRDRRATIAFEIPAREIFGGGRTARIQACVWNSKTWLCQHRLPNLVEIKRTMPAADEAKSP